MLVNFLDKQYETYVEPYLEHSFIVSRIPTNEYEYIFLIVELPTSNKEDWLFEVEYGFKDGHAETKEWVFPDIQKEYLKVEVLDYVLKTKDRRFYMRTK